jgi:phage terminase Nu1 subunit (DNA packaging protein)
MTDYSISIIQYNRTRLYISQYINRRQSESQSKQTKNKQTGVVLKLLKNIPLSMVQRWAELKKRKCDFLKNHPRETLQKYSTLSYNNNNMSLLNLFYKKNDILIKYLIKIR